MYQAWIGLIGVIIGVGLTELIRHWNRVEPLSQAIFEKRLDIYVGLYDLINKCADACYLIVNDDNLSQNDKEKHCFDAGMAVADYCTQHELFISEDLGNHCTSLMLGLADYFKTPNDKREAYVNEFWKQLRNAKRMIREDSGVDKINGYFKKVTGANLTSPVIERIRFLKAQQKKKQVQQAGPPYAPQAARR